MKDSKQVRSEYHSFVESYSQIATKGNNEAKEAEMKKKSSKKEDDDCSCEKESVLMRKNGAFTALAEKYQMSIKQFARFVENNQGLFDIETRKKAVLANKFSGFKESVEWDEFFGDLELVEQPSFEVGGGNASAARKQQKINKAADRGVPNAASKSSGPILPNVAGVKLANSHELEGEELQEVTTKDTKAGTKYKVRVKDKATGSSYIRFATREKISQLRADPKISSVEMTDEGETPEEKGEKKALAKGGGKKKLDPVGREDKDVDNDGDHDNSDKYLLKRRGAIGKAIKKRNVRTEGFSNWRDDLVEVMDKVEKKPKGGKVNNKVVINPTMGEDFDPQKIAEGLGAELISCEEVEQLDELAPLVAGGLALGAGAMGLAAIRRAQQAAKSGVDAAKKGQKIQPGTGIGQAAYGMQKKNDALRDAMKQLRQSNELEGQLISERDDEPGEGPRQRYGDTRGLDRSGPPTKFGGDFQPGGKYGPPKRPPLKQAKVKSKTQMAHFEPEGELVDEQSLMDLGRSVAGNVGGAVGQSLGNKKAGSIGGLIGRTVGRRTGQKAFDQATSGDVGGAVKTVRNTLGMSNELEGEVIDESEIGDRARRVVGDQRQGVHGFSDAVNKDQKAIQQNLLKIRPYGVKGFPSAKKNTNKTTQVAHYEMDGEVLDEKALSKKQQKLMGMVYAAKKGEKPASPEVAKAAAEMTKKAARDFAKTKHKGLPEKKKEKK